MTLPEQRRLEFKRLVFDMEDLIEAMTPKEKEEVFTGTAREHFENILKEVGYHVESKEVRSNKEMADNQS